MKPIRNTLRKFMATDAARPEVKIWLEFISFILAGSAAYLLFWLFLGAYALQAVFTGTIAFLLLSVFLFRKGYSNLSVLLVITAYLVTCLTVDYLIGWDFNIHYFILCLFPLLSTTGILSPKLRAVLYISAAASYIFGKKLMPLTSDIVPVPDWVWQVMPTVNLVVAIMIIGFSMLKFSRIMTANEKKLLEINARMADLANTDQLTGIYNRRYMYSVLDDEKFRSGSDRLPFAIAILDIDNFKQINDRFGHIAGDKVLQEIVKVIQGMIRSGDIVARWGGEEFLVLLPNTDIISGMAVMERIRLALAGKVYQHEGVEFQTTLTIGLADNLGRQHIDEIISVADERLYIGKRQGKNKTVFKS